MGKLFMEILSDEEFYEMKEAQEKEDFFKKLTKATSSSTKKMGFSVKSMKESPSKSRQQTKTSENRLNITSDPIFRKSEHSNGVFDDKNWTKFLNELDELSFSDHSPIDDITHHEIDEFAKKVSFKLSEDDVVEEDADKKYSKMFKKETAMYAEILKEVNMQTRMVVDKIKSYSQKNQQGISKYFSDMLEQYNSLTNTKITTVKNMADLKAKAEDFRLKHVKTEGEADLGVDEIVAQYYNNVMNGGRADYMSRAFLSQSPYEEDQRKYKSIVDGSYEPPEGQQVARAEWNITQPIPESMMTDDNSTDITADKHGYIQNEYRHPEVCVQRFDDNRVTFIALDEDGLEVEGYELPGDDLLESLDIKPMSNFAYDKYGRKYTIIDVNTSGADLSDLDDPNYQYDD